MAVVVCLRRSGRQRTMSETEKEKFAGKLVDRVIELDVTELAPAPFGGRLRARGRIHSTPLDTAKK